jgi:endoglucanase
MPMNKKLLFDLMEANGVSGMEGDVRKLIQKEIKKHVSDIFIDQMGNLVAHKKGGKPTIVFAAHMDEIGLMVKSIDENGKIYFMGVGGIEPMSLIGQRVAMEGKSGEIKGIITLEEMSDAHEIEDIPPMDTLFVDTGMSKSELAKEGVRGGTYLILQQEPGDLDKGDKFYGKALDDRIGCFMLIEMIKGKKCKNETYFMFTVQEEVGLYGAKTAMYTIDADMAIIAETTDADEHSRHKTKIVGKGPCLTIMDSDTIPNPCINKQLIDLAGKNKIPIQYDISDGGTTDALSISLSKGGVPVGVVGIPVKNMHTTVGISSWKDIQNGIRLMQNFADQPPKSCVL